jgi:Undecaprenyl-phosphate galactose phosphotransferase WbaP
MMPRNRPALASGEAVWPGRAALLTIGAPKLLGASPQRVKRAFDLVFAALLALAAALPALLIALAIALDSRGPVLFDHTRIGKGRRAFRLWKFRSMSHHAGARLAEYLAANPGRAREWDQTHKLRADPRVTRVGRFLRKTSLDELPQLWNVLRGDMSLIGPRPIVSQETPKYGVGFALYSQVLPGLTGLWQVSGRNDTHYSRRVDLDCQYIRNWSVALDLKILLKTAGVVVRGRGAY